MTEKHNSQSPSATQADSAPSSIPSWRLWIFRIIAVAVMPALMLLFAELALRITGYGYPTCATVKCQSNNKDAYCSNFRFGWQFWPRNIAREFGTFVFPANKSENTYRVFIIGGSAALGTPEPIFSFSRFLQVMLREKYPGINFEVINTAITAVNSHVVLPIAKDCSRHKPDLFIIYLGNNEVIGPYGPGTIFATFSGSMSFIRFDKAFKTTKLGQLLTNLLSKRTGKNIPQAWGGSKMFMKNLIRAGDPRLQTVYNHYQKNLEDIRDAARKSGAKVIFCTVGTNLKDCQPFASLHRADLTDEQKSNWEEIYQKAIDYETGDNYCEALKYFLKASEIDDSYAELQFRTGRCYWNLADYNKAKQHYLSARQLDTLRLRADAQINQTVCDVVNQSESEDVYLVDSARALEDGSPNGITDEKLFYEHVHLNFNGNYLLAKTVFQQVEKILPDWVTRNKSDKQPVLSQRQCAEYLAYTDWNRYKITHYMLNSFLKDAPFTSQLGNKKLQERMEKKVEQLEIYLTSESLKKSAARYRKAIDKTPNDIGLRTRYATLLTKELKDSWNAAEQYRRLLDIVPYYRWHVELGVLFLANQNNINASIAHNLQAAKMNPASYDAYHNLGMAYRIKGNIDKAIECYGRATKLNSTNPRTWNNLGILLKGQGKLDQAEKVYRNGLPFSQNYPLLHYNLAIVLHLKGLNAQAVEELNAALKVDPNFSNAHQLLRQLSGRP